MNNKELLDVYKVIIGNKETWQFVIWHTMSNKESLDVYKVIIGN